MRFFQRDPRFKSPNDLGERDREHYEVAQTTPGWFDKAKFLERYQARYPSRNTGSIIPSDYCFNRDNKGNAKYPRFLEWDHAKSYRFVGLQAGTGSPPAAAEPSAEPPRPAEPATRGAPTARTRLSRRTAGWDVAESSLHLDIESAESAVRAYNADPVVQGQEQSAFAALGSGFEHGHVQRQLRVLDRAYSTRSVGKDLDIIANGIERDYDSWRRLLMLAPLEQAVPTKGVLESLLEYFLARDSRRKPRSLATKALHFAVPTTFIPVDEYSAVALHSQLGTPKWASTSAMDHRDMANWYGSYLAVVHRIGRVNGGLVRDLLAVDERTTHGPAHERVRGLPKLVDKMLWWVGREKKRLRSSPRLFKS